MLCILGLALGMATWVIILFFTLFFIISIISIFRRSLFSFSCVCKTVFVLVVSSSRHFLDGFYHDSDG